MSDAVDPLTAPGSWLAWAQRLRAIAQTGATYGHDDYDLERYEEIRRIAHQMLAQLIDSPPQRLADFYLPERGYPTPKVDVRAGVFRTGADARREVLLVREESDGRWSLPGGWADEHDSPRGSIEREVIEESGFVVRASKLAAIRDRHLHPYQPPGLERIYKLLFVCDLEGGAPTVSIETTAAAFFAVDALPDLSLGRTLAQDVALLDDHERDRSLPVAFD